ncbi:MAG: methyltransferase family protein, partial [Candidatus Binataceae bacterium]
MLAPQTQPTPDLIFDTLNAYQRTAALKAAIELDIFTVIGEGAATTAALGKRCGSAERGMRILCDYMVILGFLTKQGDRYALTPDSAAFLDTRSPQCISTCVSFMLAPEMVDSFKQFAEAVRQGASVMAGEATVEPENPLWVEFARSMAALQSLPA